jgi:hypothetical protein
MGEHIEYKYLKPKPGSNYRQLFVNGRIRAEILYRETIGVEPLTPEAVAREYGLPVEAVVEAIDYCVRNQPLLDAERAREAARIKEAERFRDARSGLPVPRHELLRSGEFSINGLRARSGDVNGCPGFPPSSPQTRPGESSGRDGRGL